MKIASDDWKPSGGAVSFSWVKGVESAAAAAEDVASAIQCYRNTFRPAALVAVFAAERRLRECTETLAAYHGVSG